jgi:hypothetical protein
MSRGRDHFLHLGSKVVAVQLPSLLLTANPHVRLRHLHRLLRPASPAEVERFSEDCSRTTNSASQLIHRQFRSAQTVAEAPRPCPLRCSRPRVRCRRQFRLPSSREVAVRRQFPAPTEHLLCPNVQSKEAEAQRRCPESIRAVRRHAILAKPMMAAARLQTHPPPPDFPVLETFPPPKAAAPLRLPIPALAACGRLRRLARRLVAPRFRPAAILSVPWSVQSHPAEARRRS